MLIQPDKERSRPGRDRAGAYGLVLLSIVLTIIAAAAVGRSQWGRWFVSVLQGATLLLTLRISGAKSRARLATSVLVVLGLVVAAITVVLGDTKASYAIAAAISGLLVIGAPVAIVRGSRGQIEVTVRTVLAALSVYLLIGLFFAFVYSLMAVIDSGPFFASGTDGVLPDHLYFSYSTLTTVGFGDLTASEDFGRMTSALEALVGQLYLVTVVALLVGNLRGRRSDGIN
jgi:Ion channel